MGTIRLKSIIESAKRRAKNNGISLSLMYGKVTQMSSKQRPDIQACLVYAYKLISHERIELLPTG